MNISRPSLLIDKEKVKRNIRRMALKAKASGVVFRPHFKTHQSKEVGKIYFEEGIRQITVSSVSMAQTFARWGWNDITVAFPLNLREMATVNRLASQVDLHVLVENPFTAQMLAEKASAGLGVWIKIDTGYHRTGLSFDDFDGIDEVLGRLDSSGFLRFKGFLTHAGHTYHARGRGEVLEIMETALHRMKLLKQKYGRQHPDLQLSYGDTPSCSMAGSCRGFDEIRPGNFVYYDIMQYHLGSCGLDDIAVAVACPVVAVHPERSEMVVYGGAVHLSKEFIAGEKGFSLYGYVVVPEEDGHWQAPLPGAYVRSLSQEHGIIRLPQDALEKFRPGDLVGILPVHSCLAADLLKNDTLFV